MLSMGCASSSSLPSPSAGPAASPRAGGPQYGLLKTNLRSPLSLYEGAASVRAQRVQGGFLQLDLRYCYGSQKGFYPDNLTKANQDSFMVCERLLGDANCYVFGVFDGHGSLGDLCSHFAAAKVRRSSCYSS